MVYTPFTWHDGVAGGTLIDAAHLNRIEQGIQDASAAAVTLLAGTGIDTGGGIASTAAVQAILNAVPDGSTVVVPDGAVIALDAGITIAKRLRLTGNGELRYTGVSGAVLITVTASGVHLDGLYLTNPNPTPTTGVLVKANIFRATANRLTGFQDGIQVSALGEFHDIVIANNHVLDIIGSGLGSGNGTANGENNGDGIVVWGAAATITGNRVTCKAGSDARIGIHIEALPGQEADTTYPHRDSLGTIAGNVISGQFRRGIVDEGVAHVTITGNVIADATWWGIALIGLAHYCIVSSNTIKWTRTAADTQGSSAAPTRSGIMLFCIQEPLTHPTVVNNTVRAVAGSEIVNGIVLQAHTSVATNAAISAKITGNQLVDASGTMDNGIWVSTATTGSELRDNTVPAFQFAGVAASQGNRIAVTGNVVTGPGTTAGTRGVFLDGGATDAQVVGNSAQNVGVGIALQFRSGLLTVNSNSVRTATTGVDLFSSTAAVGTLAVNAFTGVTTKTVNVPAGVVVTGNN